MNSLRNNRIVLYLALLLYCVTLQYNIPFTDVFVQEGSSEKYFTELCIQNIAIVDNNTSTRTFYSDNNFSKQLNFSSTLIFAFKENLFSLQTSVINNFIDSIVNNKLLFKDFQLCYPFHFFF